MTTEQHGIADISQTLYDRVTKYHAQIGHAVRMIACNLGADASHRPGEQPFTLCNPEITWRSEETFSLWDDCMSFPHLMVPLR